MSVHATKGELDEICVTCVFLTGLKNSSCAVFLIKNEGDVMGVYNAFQKQENNFGSICIYDVPMGVYTLYICEPLCCSNESLQHSFVYQNLTITERGK